MIAHSYEMALIGLFETLKDIPDRASEVINLNGALERLPFLEQNLLERFCESLTINSSMLLITMGETIRLLFVNNGTL